VLFAVGAPAIPDVNNGLPDWLQNTSLLLHRIKILNRLFQIYSLILSSLSI